MGTKIVVALARAHDCRRWLLRAGEKDVAAPFAEVKSLKKHGKRWLALGVTKDALQSAPRCKYDKASIACVNDK
jgi:hypothetical protein